MQNHLFLNSKEHHTVIKHNHKLVHHLIPKFFIVLIVKIKRAINKLLFCQLYYLVKHSGCYYLKTPFPCNNIN